LRKEFGATRVVAFGSITDVQRFTPWSDIDLAAWGIRADSFFRAVAIASGLSEEFRINLVAIEDCGLPLRRVIEQEGVEV